ncbi:MAG: hypothetical protein ACTSRW_15870 [Candidatus Helarchaeota archaeon]
MVCSLPNFLRDIGYHVWLSMGFGLFLGLVYNFQWSLPIKYHRKRIDFFIIMSILVIFVFFFEAFMFFENQNLYYFILDLAFWIFGTIFVADLFLLNKVCYSIVFNENVNSSTQDIQKVKNALQTTSFFGIFLMWLHVILSFPYHVNQVLYLLSTNRSYLTLIFQTEMPFFSILTILAVFNYWIFYRVCDHKYPHDLLKKFFAFFKPISPDFMNISSLNSPEDQKRRIGLKNLTLGTSSVVKKIVKSIEPEKIDCCFNATSRKSQKELLYNLFNDHYCKNNTNPMLDLEMESRAWNEFFYFLKITQILNIFLLWSILLGKQGNKCDQSELYKDFHKRIQMDDRQFSRNINLYHKSGLIAKSYRYIGKKKINVISFQ